MRLDLTQGLDPRGRKALSVVAPLLGTLALGGLGAYLVSAWLVTLGWAAFVVAPAVLGCAAFLGGLAGATLTGRDVEERPRGLATVVGGLVLVALGVAATLPGMATGAEVAQAWMGALPLASGVAILASAGVILRWSSAPEPAPTTEEADEEQEEAVDLDPEGAMEDAYDLINDPQEDTGRLIEDVRSTAETLEEVAHSSHPDAREARRVYRRFRTEVGEELLDRAEDSLSASEAALKAHRGTASEAALRAEEVARAALDVIDPDSDDELVLRGNRIIKASRLIQDRKERPNLLEEELDEIRDRVRELSRDREEGLARSREEELFSRLGAFLVLAEATGRDDLVPPAENLLEEIRSHGSSPVIESSSEPEEADIEPLVRQLPQVDEIVQPLEGGGFGRTFLASTNIDRKIVAKTLRDKWVGSASLRKALKRESTAEGRFQHEGIPRVLLYHEVGGRPFKIMEYVSGGSLRSKLRDWYQGEEIADRVEAVRIVREVAEVLVDIQDEFPGAVHRDLKPENVLLTDDGRAKLTDFGLAHVPQLTETGEGFATDTPVGTLLYMSPEQARAETEVTPQSDVYSLGVILHEVLTSAYPYSIDEESSQSAVRDAIRRADPQIARDALPDEAVPLIEDALAVDPEDRPDLPTLADRLRTLESQLEHGELNESNLDPLTFGSDVLDSLSRGDKMVSRGPEVEQL